MQVCIDPNNRTSKISKKIYRGKRRRSAHLLHFKTRVPATFARSLRCSSRRRIPILSRKPRIQGLPHSRNLLFSTEAIDLVTSFESTCTAQGREWRWNPPVGGGLPNVLGVEIMRVFLGCLFFAVACGVKVPDGGTVTKVVHEPEAECQFTVHKDGPMGEELSGESFLNFH
ncbi:hypothetical protein L596_030248 [Steinernema carpocapsae]|uniref:Uncharacterized protein n=1 Tax=Steinernema carpocapsae TaxID=34508 RepID=A0A4U5LS62_STECR|nr:hypothetical protein L596_030248 [Steinernema carpocapsae]